MRTIFSEEKFSRTEWSRAWQVTDDDVLHGAAVMTSQEGQAYAGDAVGG